MNLWNSVKQTAGLSGSFGMVGLYLFSFTAWMSKDVAAFGLVLILLSCLMDRKLIWNAVKSTPLLWVVAATGIYILLSTFVVSIASKPEYSELHVEDGFRIFYLLGFVLIGWVMAADQKRILSVFAVALAGFVIARLWYFDWSFSTPVPWWKYRTGLGLPAIAFGHYVAAATIGLLLFAPRILRISKSSTMRSVSVLLWFLLLLMTLEGVVLSQSRSVWGSLLFLCPVLVFCVWRFSYSRVHGIAIVVSMFVLVSSFIVMNWGTIASRTMAETETYQQLFSGRFDDISTENDRGTANSIGTRLKMLEYGFKEWSRSPVFGLGPAAPKILLTNTDIPNFSHLNDFHNGVVEILVRYGAVGLLLLLLCLVYTLRCGWRAFREGEISSDLYLFLMSGMVLLLLSMLTNFRMLNYDWRYCLFMFSGALVSFELRSTVLLQQISSNKLR